MQTTQTKISYFGLGSGEIGIVQKDVEGFKISVNYVAGV